MNRSAVLVALALAAAPAPVRAEEAGDWLRLVPDAYDGEIYSGKAFMPGATEFQAGPDGLSGRYAFTEPGAEAIEGTLERCTSPKPRVLLCRWRDRYGTGSLALTFEEGLQRFEGYWWADGQTKVRAPWWGRRRIGS
ncbi:hypothetical protein [Prosthecomicrobium sp. N25]|uniref:hypothetical protein n=1 Tax=Prosthecomicrobium sp. N25 TaxID=3129254 RepID=UPI00307783D0